MMRPRPFRPGVQTRHLESRTPCGLISAGWLIALLVVLSIGCDSDRSKAPVTDVSEHGTPDRLDKILIISVDCLRADHLSTYGYERETSPAIDSLAAEGVQFNRAYAQSNWTKPSIASLFSGLYVRNHGVTVGSDLLHADGHLTRGVKSYPMPSEIILMAESFQAAGFRTGGFVENSHIVPSQGFGRGFEVYERKKPAAFWIRDWIEGLEASDRIFAFIHLIGPHDPYDQDKKAYDEYRDRFPQYDSDVDFKTLSYKKRKNLTPNDIKQAISYYDTEVAYYDADHIAPLLRWLKEVGLYDEFLIVVTADHGEELFDHGAWAHGHSLYEEVTRIPLIFKMPIGFSPQRPPGSELNENVELIDLYSTLAELSGIEAPIVDGESFASLLSGLRDPDPDAYAITEYARAVPGQILASSIVQGDDKFILRYDVDPAPKLLGLTGKIYSATSRIDGFSEVDSDDTKVDTTAIAMRLRDLLEGAVGRGSDISLDLPDAISLDPDDVKELRALGYVEGGS